MKFECNHKQDIWLVWDEEKPEFNKWKRNKKAKLCWICHKNKIKISHDCSDTKCQGGSFCT